MLKLIHPRRQLMKDDVPVDNKSVVIIVRPFGDNRFACGLDSNYVEDTEEKKMCYTVAMGLCQIALDDPDMVYEIGMSVREINRKKKELGANGQAEIISIQDWRKKLN